MALLQIHEPGETPDPHAASIAVGIDLGTTHSVIALLRGETPVAIEDGEGRSLIPSIVAWDGEKIVVGREAKVLVNAVHSIKRLMGRSTGEVEAAAPHLVSLLGPPRGSVPQVMLGGQGRTPMELSAQILMHLKRIAEAALDEPVTQAVITVPAYFDDAARLATRDAARLAGFEVLRLVNEPTAAALSYGLDHAAEGIYAIYDLGGGTFDISLLLLDRGVFQVLATAGDTALGGDDIDAALAKEFGLSIQEARHAKEQLSDVAAAGPVSREALDTIAMPYIRRTLDICAQVLGDADLTPQELKGVVLVGGSTRLHAVRRAVADYFGQPPLADADPDRVVAYGAAIQAHQLTQGSDHLLLDVIPLSLGLETMGDLAEKLIYRNSPIPTIAAQEFTTYQDGQNGMVIHVVQGEREMASQNRSLARFELAGIPALPAGVARVKVIFQVDADGLLTVSAEEQETKMRTKVEVRPSYGLPFEEIEQMIVDSMEHARDDMTLRLLSEAKVEAARLLHDTKSAMQADADLLDAAARSRLETALEMLEIAAAGDDRDAIDAASASLSQEVGPFAQKRMDRAIGQALKGTSIDRIES